MALVICNGQQWDSEQLPANINPDDCVPADEWFKQNRVSKTKPVDEAPAPAVEPAPVKQAARRQKPKG